MPFNGAERQSATEIQVKTEFEECYEDVVYHDHDLDLVFNPSVESGVALKKLKICSSGTDFYEDLQEENNASSNRSNVETTGNSNHLKFKLLVHEMRELFSKCEGKCGLCEEYVQKLHDHVNQTHRSHPSPSHEHGSCKKKYDSGTHSLESEVSVSTSFHLEDSPTTTIITPQYKSSTDDAEFQSSSSRNDPEWNLAMSFSSDDVKPIINFPVIELEHVNHFYLIQKNLKEETEESACDEDPLLDQKISQNDFTETVLSSDNAAITGITNENYSKYPTQDVVVQNLTRQKRFKCDQCGRGFEVLFDLKRHKISHTGDKNFMCEVCGKGFGLLGNLTKHKLLHKPRACNICGDSFVQKNDLTIHIISHMEQTPHKCEICGKCFNRSTHLKTHKLIHTGVKAFKCETCGKTFLLSCNLKKHELTHTKMKSFKCELCWKCFSSSEELSRHRLSHETSMELRTFKCEICQKCFSKRSYLNRHKLIHKGVKPFKCQICGTRFLRGSHLRRHELIHAKVKSNHSGVC